MKVDMQSTLAIALLILGISGEIRSQESPSDVQSQVQYLITSSPSASRVGAEPVGNMGNLAFPISLEIPPSRSETQPELQVVYNSADQSHGSFMGQSWSLELGFIERSTKSGVPSYTPDDEFVISLGKAQGELVQVDVRTDTLEYRMQREKLFLLIYFIESTNRWVAIDKKGTEYHFGETVASRSDDGVSRTFRWALSRVFVPQFNHTTAYTYDTIFNQLYPRTINYFHGQVNFTYDIHPQQFRSFKTGFEIRTIRLLREITASHLVFDSANTIQYEPSSIYRFRYINHQCGIDEFNRIICLTPYLQSITRFNGTRTDSLPPTLFEYDDQSLELANAQLTKWLVPLISDAGFTDEDGEDNNAVELIDVNGDNFPDLLHADGTTQRATFLNNQINAWNQSTLWRVSTTVDIGFTESNGEGDNGVRFADVNRDGFIDIIKADGDTPRETFLNNRISGWTTSLNWRVPEIADGGFTEDVLIIGPNNTVLTEDNVDQDNGVQFADVNNDGFVDIVQADGDDQRTTLLNNTSDAWVTDTVWIIPVISGAGFTEDDGEGDNGVRLADVNNDGYVDIIHADGDDQRGTFINNPLANDFEADTRWQVPVIAGAGFTEDDGEDDNGVRLADVNGDGFVDIIQADGDDQRATFLNNTIDGWFADSRWQVPVIAGGGFTEDDGEDDNGVRLADVDNDGFVDIVVADGNDMQQHITFINNRIDGWILISLPVSRLDFEGNWQVTSKWEVPIMDKGGFNEKEGSGNNGVRLADVNADGFLDFVQADGDDSDQHVTFLNNRKDGWELSPLWQIPVLDKGGFTEGDGGGDNTLQVTDLNKDGFPDLLQADGDDEDQHQAFLNDGKGSFELTPGWAVPMIDNGGFTESGGDGDNGVRMADVNGDGYPDIVQADGDDQRRTLFNDKVGGWLDTSAYQVPVIDVGGFTEGNGDGDNAVRLADVNGDGLVDLVVADDEEQREIHLNNGNGQWISNTNWQIPAIHAAGFTEDGGDGDNAVRFADLNFDGFVDLIQGDGDDQRDVYLNDGSNGWIKVTSWQVPLITSGGFTEDDGEGDNGLNISDVNGDGFPDLVQGDGLEERRTFLNAMTRPPLLNKIDNGIGGIIEIEYETHPGRPIVYTVNEIRESDGFQTNLSHFEFSDPFFDPREQEFRGFGRTKSIINGAVFESFYHQANGDNPATFEKGDSLGVEGYVYFTKIGKAEDPNFLFQAHRNEWSLHVDRAFTEYHLVQLKHEISYDFASDGIAHTAHAKGYEYDSLGNVTRLTDFKYVADPFLNGYFTDLLSTDNVITVTEYAKDTSRAGHIRGFPSRIMAQDINGAILRESRIFYDSLPYGQLRLGLPSMEQKLRVYTDQELSPREFVTNSNPASPEHVPYMDTVAILRYDTLGNVIMRTNPNGDTKFYAYDSSGMYAISDSIMLRRSKATPLPYVNHYEYDRRTGQQSQVTKANGAVARMTYDPFGRILELAESDPNDSIVRIKETYRYELFGASNSLSNNRTVKTRQQDGIDLIEQEITYVDGFYRKVQTKNLTSDTTFSGFRTQCYTYGRDGRLERSFQPYFTTGEDFTPIELDRPHMRTHFDPVGRLVHVQPVEMSEADSPMAGETREYSVQGFQTARTILKGDHETRYLYNSGGQITDIFQRNGKEVLHTQYFYDVLDRLIRIVDHRGAETTFTYDSMDEKREMDDPSTGHAFYAYDGGGNVILYADAKQDTTTFTYDELYRILSKEFSQDASEKITYAYDENNFTGYLTTVISKHVRSRYQYNILGDLTQHERQIENKLFVLKTEYDPYGRLLSITYPNDKQVEYEYYASGALLRQVTMDDEVIAAFDRYTALAKPGTFHYGNEVVTENTFYASNERIEDTSVKDESGHEIQGFSYRFDDHGNVRFVNNRRLQSQRRFAYDQLNRLVEWEKWQGTDPNGIIEQFSYDAIGNIVEKDSKDYVYEEDRPYVLANFGGQAITHDANGNQTVGSNGRKYVYDVLDRLIEVRAQNNSLLATYKYDSANGRVAKRSPGSGNTIYIDNLYEDRQQAQRNVMHIYAHGHLIASVTSRRPGLRGQFQYYHHDHLGSITLITDQNGHVTDNFDYKPYGEQIIVSGTSSITFGFNGQPADTDVGLIYYQSRYYDPVMGRFIQPDRYVPRPEDPQTLNRYAYVGNNPITFVDPTGHWFGWDDLLAAGVGFAVGFTYTLIASDFDFKAAFAAGLSTALTAWVTYSTFGLAGAIIVGSAQVASLISNEVFEGSTGGSVGDAIQLVTTFAASPVVSTVGLIVGVSYILFTDRTWADDFHYVDGTLWFRDPFRGKAAMTTGAVIHYDDALGFDEETLSHELIHRRQFGFVGDGFLAVYFGEIGIRMLFGQSQDAAYRASVFEAEAYGKESAHGSLGSPEEAIDIIQLFDRNILVTAPGRF